MRGEKGHLHDAAPLGRKQRELSPPAAASGTEKGGPRTTPLPAEADEQTTETGAPLPPPWLTPGADRAASPERKPRQGPPRHPPCPGRERKRSPCGLSCGGLGAARFHARPHPSGGRTDDGRKNAVSAPQRRQGRRQKCNARS